MGGQLAKNVSIVLGMTEREGGPTPVEDARLFDYLFAKDLSRKEDDDVVVHDQAIDEALVITRQTDQMDHDFVGDAPMQLVFGDDEDDDDEPVPVPDQPQQPETLPPAPEGQQEVRPRFKMERLSNGRRSSSLARKTGSLQRGPSSLLSPTAAPRP